MRLTLPEPVLFATWTTATAAGAAMAAQPWARDLHVLATLATVSAVVCGLGLLLAQRRGISIRQIRPQRYDRWFWLAVILMAVWGSLCFPLVIWALYLTPGARPVFIWVAAFAWAGIALQFLAFLGRMQRRRP